MNWNHKSSASISLIKPVYTAKKTPCCLGPSLWPNRGLGNFYIKPKNCFFFKFYERMMWIFGYGWHVIKLMAVALVAQRQFIFKSIWVMVDGVIECSGMMPTVSLLRRKRIPIIIITDTHDMRACTKMYQFSKDVSDLRIRCLDGCASEWAPLVWALST